MKVAPVIARPTCFALHTAGEQAFERGLYELAAQLFYEAAGCALTRSGADVLFEKARLAEQQHASATSALGNSQS